MFNLDPGKLLIIGVVGIILLGPDRLPQVARQLGAAWRSFGEFRQRMETEVRGSIPDLPSTTEIARLARSPSALLNHLSNMDDANTAEANAAGDAANASREAEKAGGDNDAASASPVASNGASANGSETKGAETNGTTPNGTEVNGTTPNGTKPAPFRPAPQPASPPPDIIVTGDPSLN